MVYNRVVQYPAITRPVPLNPEEQVNPVWFEAWWRQTEQPIIVAGRPNSGPSLFFVGEPGDFTVIDVSEFQWAAPTELPVYPVEYRYQLESIFHVIDPDTFPVIPVPDMAGWVQPTNQYLFAKSESARRFESYFYPNWEQIISTPDLVDFATWVQPASQPVLPIEYRYLLPSVFSQIAPADFPVPPEAPTPPFTINDTLVIIQSYLVASGYFADVTIGEPESVVTGTRLSAAVWYGGTRIPFVTLGKTTKVYEIMIRIYRDMLAEPQSEIEFQLAEVVQDIGSDLLGDFDLGATVRNIDAAGEFGRPMRASWGYAPVSGTMFRVADMTIPVVVNDTATLAP